jgi:hypothetical protein
MKAVQGNFYKGFYDPLPKLDPDRSLIYGAYDLSICRNCLQMYGRLVRVLPNSPEGHKRSAWRKQKCQCMKNEDKSNGIADKIWPGNDFNTSVELCYCCGKKLITSGSKFSSFYCVDCKKIIEAFNKYSEDLQIPLGRHSFMIGLRLQLPCTSKEEELFKKKLDGFFRKVDLVFEWRKLTLFENLHDLGFHFDADISIGYYDSLIKIGENDSDKKFTAMLAYIKENQKTATLEKNSKKQLP